MSWLFSFLASPMAVPHFNCLMSGQMGHADLVNVELIELNECTTCGCDADQRFCAFGGELLSRFSVSLTTTLNGFNTRELPFL